DKVLVTKSGEIWARAAAQDYLVELMRYNPATHSFSKGFLIDGNFWDKQPILEGQKGEIWMTGYGGKLARFDPLLQIFNYFDFSNPKEPLAERASSTALYEDANRVLWIGTQEGFVRATPQPGSEPSFQFAWFKNNPNDPNSLNYNHISCFLDDPAEPNRYLWICTKGGGLNRFDKQNGEFLHLTTKNGLPNNVVYGLLSDDEGNPSTVGTNLWGSTNRGIFCLTPPAQGGRGAEAVFRNFTKNDGLQDDEFNTGAYAKLPDGRLAFGGINGVNIFNPKDILSGDFLPNVFITNILVNNQPVTPGDATGVLNMTIETSASITLTHEQDILTLEFASLDFTSPSQNKYRYQLIGADRDWVFSDTRRSATYLHLPSGTYTFRVQGSNSRGIWSDHIAALKIKVMPPWWRSIWAYLFYAVLLAVAVRAYFRFTVNRAKLRAQLAYETREAERVKELDVVKTQLYTNITHEFRTPLTIILGMAQQVLDNPKEHFRNGMDMILRNGQNLLKLVNELLDLSKLESGKMSLQMVQGDVVQFLRYISESFHSLSESRKSHLHFLSELDSLVIDYDPEKLRQIVSNLLSNALKFTPAGGNVYFSVGIRESDNNASSLLIKVKDTGIGIPESQLPHIFDRFYQVDDSSTRPGEGSGIGLALTKELVKLMEGEITVKSPPTGAKKGSEFAVVLPIMRSSERGIQDLKPILQIPNIESLVLPSKDSAHATASIPPSKQPLILLVEDNADVVAYTASCLQGYRLAVGKDGQEGLDIATEIIPDLIISDVMMPVMDGFELCRKLKTDERTSHIPVIILTAKADMDSKLEGLERGADAYLEKPFNKEELLVRTRKLLELRSQLQQHYLKSAGLTEGAVIIKDIPNLEKSEDAFVQKVKASVESHLADFEFNVEQLCKEVHMSQSQLQRKLDALTGFSPNQFIRNIRLNKAKELLRNPELSITAVAFDCGFNDPGYFSRVFKQELGVTPLEWREKVGI
ncbi:MAG: helix-turn-helix domain-containing protein, partial [Phycisphaerae bacterium]|nr:helix-turn-helix domain-containing protein [Saprospiraceae bacterium]